MSTPNPNAADCAVVVGAKQTATGKCGFSHLVQALIHATDQIARHEGFGELVVVLVLSHPNAVVLRVKLCPEVRDGFCLFFVGVKPLEVVHVEGALWHVVKRI